MALMNIFIHFKYGLWKPFPMKTEEDKFLFDWDEENVPFKTTWRYYCLLKYPLTIKLEDT